jgi:cell division protein FtsA
MTHRKFIAAIDIGTTKIVAIVGVKENNSFRILGIGNTSSRAAVKRGIILNIEETVNAIKYAVDMVQESTGCILSEVFVGIAGQHIKSITNRGYVNRDSYETEISAEDVKALIEDMHRTPIDIGEQIIHVLPQNYIVDNECGVKQPVGMFGKRLEGNFHIVIGQITSISNINKCIERAGLKIVDLILEPIASSYAVLTEDEKEAGVALVDIGGGTSDIAIYYDGIIRHTAVIPFGGNVITGDIKTGFCILERYAEQIKVEYGSALAEVTKDNEVVTIPGINGRDPKEISLKNLALVIQARMEEIIGIIKFHLDNSGFADKLGAGIVITGGGAMLKNLTQLIAFHTGYDVRIGLPNTYLVSETEENVNQPMYSTSIGLILQGYENMKNRDKFYDTEVEDDIYITQESEPVMQTENIIQYTETEDSVPDDYVEPKKEKTKIKKPKDENRRTLTKLIRDGLVKIFDEKDNSWNNNN